MNEEAQFAPLFGPAAPEEGFSPLCSQSAGSAAFQPLSSFPPEALTPESGAETPAPAPVDMEELLRQAHERAARIVAEAEAEGAARAERMVAAALEAERRTQAEAFRAAADELLDALREHAVQQRAQFEQGAARLVVAIARRILHERFDSDEAAIVPVVREALRPFAMRSLGAATERVQVVIAPRHQPALRAAHEELARVLRESAQLEIVPVEGAEPYGCVVHGEESSVDARLEQRLHAFQDAIDEHLDPACGPYGPRAA